ncbi:MAG: 50S ribosomal protein L3 [Bacillota bacterium]|uniref:Large ribosomal subunit protein uL3 n=2 Tax=Carboxydocella TaxID=178898 RepID=A0A1T4SAP2_9FIRM|nr:MULTISPECIES: 50S ribosomal protein L3 [Carboxydocella]AVX21807.1 LSU ribosomal protein L3P [Carboxydocella thermautotrophica]AVX32211.1 LSU ribosomal protein L3P [Carboxydocella thermautotrophica]SKA25282.1 LSU ribosomal protein L3P [Carboxydocella sporoproducens DSM 16521]GAW27561.1 50S ribosomal protein L3 [Carboxydocella sp. ULO1]GAW30931.1 50S ribosomal protein L3 [Carboxydocella sp. JDF658]
MAKGILGRKVGMTQLFTEDGKLIPVTVIEAGPCVVVQKKTVETDGYNAIQVAFGDVKETRVNKPLKGHFAKAGVQPKRYVREFRVDNVDEYQVGQEIFADIFAEGEAVDVTGISKGKGFAGAIKRHGFARGPMAHGSKYHRRVGSLGAKGPARVFKGRPLPGRMGGERVTVQNLQVVKVDRERNLLVIKGSVPGNKNSLLIIKPSVKA